MQLREMGIGEKEESLSATYLTIDNRVLDLLGSWIIRDR